MRNTLVGGAFIIIASSGAAVASPCTSYPHTLVNGAPADANDVMDNFNCAARTGGATMDGTTFTGTTTFPGSSTVSSGGNVGIGGAPTVPLHVLNASRAEIRIESTAAAPSLLRAKYNAVDFGYFGDAKDVLSASLNSQDLGVVAVNDVYLASGAGSAIFFWQSGTERGRFGSDGSFLIGTTSNGGWPGNAKAEIRSSVHGMSVYSTGSTGGVALLSRVDNTANWLEGFYYGTTNVGGITTNGTSAAYNTTSDGRLKNTNVQQRNYRSTIEKLWVGDFKWKKDGSAGFGIVAQQAFFLFPEAVSKPADERKIWQADYSKLAPLALWGVKDLYKMEDRKSILISAQSNEIADLKRRLAKLEARIEYAPIK